MLKLILLRHGEAVNYSSREEDFERSLSEYGRDEIRRSGSFLRENNYIPDQIISSGAARTTETTHIVQNQLSSAVVPINDGELFLASADKILHYICKHGRDNTLLYVGHNFGISNIVEYLTGTPVLLSTGSVIVLCSETENWSLLSKETCRIMDQFVP